METLTSSFLQKYAPNHSTLSHTLLLHQKFNVACIKLDENFDHTSTHKKLHTLKKPPTFSPYQNSNIITKQKKQSFLTIFFNSLDNFICDFIDPPLRPSIDPKHVLSGNFAPVDELPPIPCKAVEGSLPPSLNGTYIRNGPNPQFIPRGPYHLFDGDGMLHAIKISNGKATLCSRFVKTHKYTLERDTGSPLILNVFSAFNGLMASLARCTVVLARVLTRQYDPTRGMSRANTSLALISGKLFALEESDLPYRIKITKSGDIITLGRHEPYGTDHTSMTMTAHPKLDMETGETFAFRQSFLSAPFLTYFRIDQHGIKQPEVPISSLKQASFIHDFAVSENYALFNDTQMVFKMGDILKGKVPISFDSSKVARLGVIPRYALDEKDMWWVEVPGFNMAHAVNAWEEDEGDRIVMVAPNVLGVEHALEHIDLTRSRLERVEIDVKERKVTSRHVVTCNDCVDFPVINPAYVGKKIRYVYAAIGAPMPKIAGVVKVDLSLSTANSEDCTVASRLYGPGCYGGEPFFVPREPDNPNAEEDDGYLISYVHNENTEESKFIVMDSKSPSLEIIASVKLPRRVPYGFHGIFVPESHLGKL